MADNLTLTFTRDEWRLLAAAAAKVRANQLLDGQPKVTVLRLLAQRIATETGREG